MIMHIKFSDTSNPYVAYGDSCELCAAWKKWRDNPTASPVFWGWAAGYRVMRNDPGDGSRPWWYLETPNKMIYYRRLGMALRALDRLGDEARMKEV